MSEAAAYICFSSCAVSPRRAQATRKGCRSTTKVGLRTTKNIPSAFIPPKTHNTSLHIPSPGCFSWVQPLLLVLSNSQIFWVQSAVAPELISHFTFTMRANVTCIHRALHCHSVRRHSLVQFGVGFYDSLQSDFLLHSLRFTGSIVLSTSRFLSFLCPEQNHYLSTLVGGNRTCFVMAVLEDTSERGHRIWSGMQLSVWLSSSFTEPSTGVKMF